MDLHLHNHELLVPIWDQATPQVLCNDLWVYELWEYCISSSISVMVISALAASGFTYTSGRRQLMAQHLN